MSSSHPPITLLLFYVFTTTLANKSGQMLAIKLLNLRAVDVNLHPICPLFGEGRPIQAFGAPTCGFLVQIFYILGVWWL
jgi:hypothetical protein